jgi:hypothetical protein
VRLSDLNEGRFFTRESPSATAQMLSADLSTVAKGGEMAFFDDFRDAIDKYDGDNMDVKLVAYQFLGPGAKLNPGEWFRCQIQVYNQGQLNLKGVTVIVRATSFAQVSLGPGNPTSFVVVPFGNLSAHSSAQSGQWVYGFAIADTGGQEKDVITASIWSWDADLNHLLNDHSGFGPPEGAINVAIFPG